MTTDRPPRPSPPTDVAPDPARPSPDHERRYRELFEHMPSGVALCRMIFEGDRPVDWIYLDVNAAFVRQTGLVGAEGKRVSELLPGLAEADPALFEVYGRVARTGVPHRFQTFVHALDAWFEVSVHSNERDHFVAIFDVVTEQKRAEAALRASEARYRTLVDNMDIVVFTTDLDGRITFVNGAMAIFGFTPAEIIGRHRDEFVHPDDIPFARRARAEQSALGQPQPIEYRLVDAAGRSRPVRAFARPLRVDDRLVGATGVLVDLTAQRTIEDQLREAQKMEAVGRLAGGVAHDFNNLLSVILSYTEMAVHGLHVEDPLRADLGEVLDAAKRAEGLTRQLLAFSRRQILTPEPIDLGRLVVTIAKMLRRLIGEDIELEVLPAGPLTTIKADRGQLEQVLMNLAVNARDAMPDGGRLTIATTRESLAAAAAQPLEVPPGEYVVLTIADTGSGMDEATRVQAFEPFFTTKPVGKGTGLGLSMVYGIVRQSGGGISLASTPGAGATFRIYLPCHEELPREEAAPAPAAQRPSGKERVLVVDDEPAVLHVVRRSLATSGFDVLVAANAAEALQLCELHGASLQLVITDVVMPGMGGRELAAKLEPLCPGARVLFMSGYADDDLARRGVLGSAFLRKPFDRQTLVAKVRSVLDGG